MHADLTSPASFHAALYDGSIKEPRWGHPKQHKGEDNPNPHLSDDPDWALANYRAQTYYQSEVKKIKAADKVALEKLMRDKAQRKHDKAARPSRLTMKGERASSARSLPAS